MTTDAKDRTRCILGTTTSEINISRSLSLCRSIRASKMGKNKRKKERIKYSRVVDAPSSERGRIKASPKIAAIFNEKKREEEASVVYTFMSTHETEIGGVS